MAVTGSEGIALLAARDLFGGVLAFKVLNHFLQPDGMAAYAEAKELPAPRLAVVFSGGMLVFGGVLAVLGALVPVAAGALVGFLFVTTPLMHTFWAVPGDQKQDEMTQFLKNAALLGASLSLFALASQDWASAIGFGF